MPDETVTYCHACQSNRLCRHYSGYWICVKTCWRKRKTLVTYWRGLASKEEERRTV